eukprot:13008919-Heterocapsa_arctica.AAC.1
MRTEEFHINGLGELKLPSWLGELRRVLPINTLVRLCRMLRAGAICVVSCRLQAETGGTWTAS